MTLSFIFLMTFMVCAFFSILVTLEAYSEDGWDGIIHKKNIIFDTCVITLISFVFYFIV